MYKTTSSGSLFFSHLVWGHLAIETTQTDELGRPMADPTPEKEGRRYIGNMGGKWKDGRAEEEGIKNDL